MAYVEFDMGALFSFNSGVEGAPIGASDCHISLGYVRKKPMESNLNNQGFRLALVKTILHIVGRYFPDPFRVY